MKKVWTEAVEDFWSEAARILEQTKARYPYTEWVYNMAGKNPILWNIQKIPRNEVILPKEKWNAFLSIKDWSPIEIHHVWQKAEWPFVEMTKSDHRLWGNYKINHTNYSQSSSINRSQFNNWKTEYWGKEYDNFIK